MIDIRFDQSHSEYRRRLAFALAMQANVTPTSAVAVRPLMRIVRVIRAMLVSSKNAS
jgi:hypothetical protein